MKEANNVKEVNEVQGIQDERREKLER